MASKFIITGIGTDVGKTIASAILCECLNADYWKPVQAGDLNNSDSHKINQYISNLITKIHPESYKLNTPASPHLSAQIDKIEIDFHNIIPPLHNNPLIIEGAGGLHVPLNNTHTYIDLFKKWNFPVILISRNYLGSINHTLLSIEALNNRNIPIKAVIFNGIENPSTQQVIQHLHPKLHYFNIPQLETINQQNVKIQAENLKKQGILSLLS